MAHDVTKTATIRTAMYKNTRPEECRRKSRVSISNGTVTVSPNTRVPIGAQRRKHCGKQRTTVTAGSASGLWEIFPSKYYTKVDRANMEAVLLHGRRCHLTEDGK